MDTRGTNTETAATNAVDRSKGNHEMKTRSITALLATLIAVTASFSQTSPASADSAIPDAALFSTTFDLQSPDGSDFRSVRDIDEEKPGLLGLSNQLALTSGIMVNPNAHPQYHRVRVVVRNITNKNFYASGKSFRIHVVAANVIVATTSFRNTNSAAVQSRLLPGEYGMIDFWVPKQYAQFVSCGYTYTYVSYSYPQFPQLGAANFNGSVRTYMGQPCN